MNPQLPQGILIPIITPFKGADAAEVDEAGLRKVVNYLIVEQKAAGLVPCGTTGECPTLSHSEHLEVIRIVVEETAGRVPVVAGTGSNSTHEAIELTKGAVSLGADFVLSVVPYYNKPSQRGLIGHFEKIASASSVPVLLYDIPGRSVVNLSLESYQELMRFGNIAGVKIAPRSFSEATALLAHLQETGNTRFQVYCGEDIWTFAMACHGSSGGITAAAHVVGALYGKMFTLIQSGDIHSARQIFNRTSRIVELCFIESNPAPIKYMLTKSGFHMDSLRLPLTTISPDSKSKIDQAWGTIF